MSLKEFNASAKVARKAPFDRNGEQPLVFHWFSKCARAEILDFPEERILCFHEFQYESMLNLLKMFLMVSTCSRGGRAHVARMVLFDGDSCNG